MEGDLAESPEALHQSINQFYELAEYTPLKAREYVEADL